MLAPEVGQGFEKEFLAKDFSAELATCDRYALLPLFMELLPDRQPLLEAGCGSGKWMHYLKRKGVRAVGIDWSAALAERSRAYDPEVPFDVGDLRALPYPDAAFGSVLALGSIEHVFEGPGRILREFHRVLRPGGMAVVTVPFYSPLRRRCSAIAGDWVRRLQRAGVLRRLAGKPPAGPASDTPLRRLRRRRYHPAACLQVDFDGRFYQYQFDQVLFAQELIAAGFVIERMFPFGAAEGLLATCGRICGRFDRARGAPALNGFGQWLLRRLAVDQCGHMLCGVARKSARSPERTAAGVPGSDPQS